MIVIQFTADWFEPSAEVNRKMREVYDRYRRRGLSVLSVDLSAPGSARSFRGVAKPSDIIPQTSSI